MCACMMCARGSMRRSCQALGPYSNYASACNSLLAQRQALKYLKRWAVHIGPAFVLAYGTVKWADHEFEAIHREHWD